MIAGTRTWVFLTSTAYTTIITGLQPSNIYVGRLKRCFWSETLQSYESWHKQHQTWSRKWYSGSRSAV